MEEPEDEELDDEIGEEENPDPNGGPSVAGLLLICVGVGCFIHPPLRTETMDAWAVAVLNWPFAGALIGGGIGVLMGKGRQGAIYGAIVGICITAMFLLKGHLNPIGN